MRFMIIGKATKETEAGILPKPELFEAMGKYNEELVKAGILLAAEGLAPTSKGARVKLTIIEHASWDGVIQHSADGGAFPYSPSGES